MNELYGRRDFEFSSEKKHWMRGSTSEKAFLSYFTLSGGKIQYLYGHGKGKI